MKWVFTGKLTDSKHFRYCHGNFAKIQIFIIWSNIQFELKKYLIRWKILEIIAKLRLSVPFILLIGLKYPTKGGKKSRLFLFVSVMSPVDSSEHVMNFYCLWGIQMSWRIKTPEFLNQLVLIIYIKLNFYNM